MQTIPYVVDGFADKWDMQMHAYALNFWDDDFGYGYVDSPIGCPCYAMPEGSLA